MLKVIILAILGATAISGGTYLCHSAAREAIGRWKAFQNRKGG